MKLISLLALLLFASAGEPCLSLDQAKQLAVEAMNHTPDHTHFAKGSTFSWVVLAPATEACPELSRAIRAELVKRYTVYDTVGLLPAAAKRSEGMGEAYVDGFVFTVRIKRLSRTDFEVTYNDFEGPLAAGTQTFRYRWRRGKWHVLSKGSLLVA